MENSVFTLGKKVFERANALDSKRSAFKKASDKLLAWTMQNEELKVSLLRFIDVLPNLDSAASVVRVAREYFPQEVASTIPGFKYALSVSPDSSLAFVGAKAVKTQIRSVAKQFILGERPKEAIPKLKELRKAGYGFTIDLLGEETLSETEASLYQRQYLEMLDELAKAKFADVPLEKGRGLNISVKLSALYSQITPESQEHSASIVLERVRTILEKAREYGCYVYFDMEDTSLTSLTIEVYKLALYAGFESLGIVLQAYLRRTEDDLTDLLLWAKTNGKKIGVRLVKGAYWDTETIKAKQKLWPIPVWQVKENSDFTFEKLSRLLLDNVETCYPAFGSHNIRSLCYAVCYAESHNIGKDKFELQALYGMAEGIKESFREMGFLVRDYAPVGELLPGMSYLVRRLLENTSNESFLRQGFHEDETPENLLKAPNFSHTDTGDNYANTNVFQNLPPLDFCYEEERAEIKAHLSQLTPAVVYPVINGKDVKSDNVVKHFAPHDRISVVADVHYANTNQVEDAIASLDQTSWSKTSFTERAEILMATADILEKRRHYFTALVILEACKQWKDADGEVCEAIDFLRYYATEARKFDEPLRLSDEAGELNRLIHVPRGPAVVIGPWNFPCAIPAGMFAANLVCGNTAILKPAEQTSRIAYEVFKTFLEAGLPESAAAFIPGSGEEVGSYLASDKRITTIAFTGSRAIGTHLIKLAGEQFAEIRTGKKVVAEMGGKNAIIVDETADLDEAVSGIITSAFGFQGQKCSACSRLIVVEEVYEKLCERLKEAVLSIRLGPATEPENKVGAVIDQEAEEKISSYIKLGKSELKLLAEVTKNKDLHSGYIAPVVFHDVPPEHRLMQEEIFGPVLCITKAKTVEEAVEIANNQDYALTGAVYSRSPDNINYVAVNFNAGNFYINRNCTGAMVKRHPFGGYNQSGIGAKTGGTDYLRQFLNQRAISENTIRRGFAPEFT